MSRYIMLVPALLVYLCYVLSRIASIAVSIRRLVLCAVWVRLAYRLADNFNLWQTYAPLHHERRNLYACVRA